MRVAVHSVYVDYRRQGRKRRGNLQPGIGPLIAGLLPRGVDVEVINETWSEPYWSRAYDLVFISSMHADFDRARQVSHYWRRRGAKTVYGGTMASSYPTLCRPYFDAVVVGDAEGVVPEIYDDFTHNRLQPLYISREYDAVRLPVPRFRYNAGRHPLPLSLEATRACPFSCEFCVLTALGTRYHTRPVETVVRDIRAGQRMLAGKVSWPQRKIVQFLDNNIGGNPKYLRALCAALEPLGIYWGSAITFNVLSLPGMVETMARSGCRGVFVGLESFNPATIKDMRKFQNTISKIESVIERCQRNGILLEAGLMVSPSVDDRQYVRTIPERLAQVGLYRSAFVAIEAPIPGTPYFRRLAARPEPALLPNALLRDFTGFTLTVRPEHSTPEQFIADYRWVVRQMYGLETRVRKLAHDLPRLIGAGGWVTAMADVVAHLAAKEDTEHARTYIAGTDRVPPEMSTVPLTDADFATEEERRVIMEPWRVTDETGRVLPWWTEPMVAFERGGRISQAALALTGS